MTAGNAEPRPASTSLNVRAASESGRRQLHQQDGQGTVR